MSEKSLFSICCQQPWVSSDLSNHNTDTNNVLNRHPSSSIINHEQIILITLIHAAPSISSILLQKLPSSIFPMKVKRKEKSIIIQEDSNEAHSPSPKPQKSDLKNIIEVTEENQNPPTMPKIVEASMQHPSDVPQMNCLERVSRCVRALWQKAFSSPNSYQIDLNSNDLTQIIDKLRRHKGGIPLLPPQAEHKRVLVLDLDETLVHTSFARPAQFDYQLQVQYNGKETKIYTVKRFGLDAFLFEMSQIYEVVVFTASQQLYADRVIDLIDPRHRITHRLYRQHCVAINKAYFLKNILALGRTPKDVIIVDDNAIAGLLQPDNFYKIEPFNGCPKDRQLCRLSAFLKHLQSKPKLAPIAVQRRLFQDQEITLGEQGKEGAEETQWRSLAQRKRQYQHKKTTSEIQELTTKSTEEETQAETTASDLVKSL